METIYDYSHPASPQELSGEQETLAGMVRHLKARLEEFEAIRFHLCSQEQAQVEVTMEGYSAQALQKALWDFRAIAVALGEEKDSIRFYLRPQQRHETIDTIWGALFTMYSQH